MGLTLSERFRAILQEPFKTVRNMGVSEGQSVVDVGAGTGYFTMPAASVVGRSGMVYAVEPDRARSERIRQRAAMEGLGNVRVLTTGAEHLGEIPSGSVDLAFSAFSIHHFSDRQAGLEEVRRTLREGGRFYVWDRVPGTLVRHGTRPEELQTLKGNFRGFEMLDSGRTLKARFTK